MSTDDESLDEMARQLEESGEATIDFDAEGGETLEGAAGFLTALAELEGLESQVAEVEITIRS